MADSTHNNGRGRARASSSSNNHGNQRRGNYRREGRRPYQHYGPALNMDNLPNIPYNYYLYHDLPNYFEHAVHMSYTGQGSNPRIRNYANIPNTSTVTSASNSDQNNSDQGSNSTRTFFNHNYFQKKNESALSQREKLSKQLDNGVLECLVCCERIKQPHFVWSCDNCFHVLHLLCIKKWANSSFSDNQWPCPACRNPCSEIPNEYRCFCGGQRDPEFVKGQSGAHSCGEMCRRQRPPGCPHPCPLLCHPGACPPCAANIIRTCGCGGETRTIACRSWPFLCKRTCGKPLKCGRHMCKETCHIGECNDCEENIIQECCCPSGTTREFLCRETVESSWSCGKVCNRLLACGNHRCPVKCHAGPCPSCKLLPENVITCPCGKKKLRENASRTTCLDPVPVCGNICAKPFACGPEDDVHFCKEMCHEGECPPCQLETRISCRCGHLRPKVKCVTLSEPPSVECKKKCNKMLSCGRHRCQDICCNSVAHRCPTICGRTLACGNHRCEQFCHTGHCKTCERVSFYELTCRCGLSVIHPPVPCGARLPECSKECSVPRACGHPARHNCHPTREDCPPCLTQTRQFCYGQHEERNTIACHQESFSCGMPCNKLLACGKHNCIKPCHQGECEFEPCKQACRECRPSCGHPCGAPCHFSNGGPCPARTVCRIIVRVTCPCGRRGLKKTCEENAREAAKIASTAFVSTVTDHNRDGFSIPENILKPSINFKTLVCDEECKEEARAKQLAIAFQVPNADVTSKPVPKYSEFVRHWAVKDPAFVQMVYDQLKDLVIKAKASKQKNRSYSFPSMNKTKRQLVHEMSEYFGCESRAYDAEPNRNVVATADKEKVWLPSLSVNEVLAREAGLRKRLPPPKLNNVPSASTTPNSSWATLAAPAWGQKRQL